MAGRIRAVAAVWLALSAPCLAIELTLAENRGESGSIGYVDVERIFKAHPATVRVKDELEKEITRREEQLTGKRQELYSLRAELEKLRRDRETLRKRADREEAETAARLAAEERARQLAAEADAKAVKQAAAAAAAVSSDSVAGAETVEETERDLAGAQALLDADQPAAPAEVAGSTAAVPAAQGAAVSTFTAARQTAAAAEPAAPQAVEPPMPPVAAVSAGDVAVSTRAERQPVPRSPSRGELEALEEKIADMEVQVLGKETSVEEFRQRAEKELLDYEQKRMQLILGNIYLVLRDVAISEGVSVVVDRKSILYGQNAVDLTDKLLDKLSGR
ncbi:MAG: OmpH family outer membrane protein [Elusimicrobiaceae bacterium]|nr:OmpH family outer membrane protein [Elusimicrobiaceae bacterium]